MGELVCISEIFVHGNIHANKYDKEWSTVKKYVGKHSMEKRKGQKEY